MHRLPAMLLVISGFLSLDLMALSDIYIYPNNAQSAEQQSQDRYECHIWAANQSGFDPSSLSTTAATPVLVASGRGRGHSQRGLDPVSGAAGGAALGALGGAIGGDAGKGAAIGAGVGALAGIFSAAGNQQRLREQRAHQLAMQQQQGAVLEQQKQDYRRAISACLEAHNYTVK